MALLMVLAAIAIPVALGAQREAREAKLRADLQTIRKAINRYVLDCGGYPDKLEHLVAAKAPRHCRDIGKGSKLRIDPSDFHGPYIYTPDAELPPDPITGKALWFYNRQKGEVRSRAPGKALDGTQYKDW